MIWALLFAAHAAPHPFGVPPEWIDALRRAEVMHPDRQTVHVSHTCNLRVDGEVLHVVDVRELLVHMPAPRGINHVAVLNSAREVVWSFRYADERPLRCDGAQLLLWAPVALEAGGSGNVLMFSAKGREVSPRSVALGEFPWEGPRTP